MKILIADDELLVRRSIRMFLTDLGVRPDDMVETGDGFGLVEAIGVSHFDLALVDIRIDDFKYAQEAIRLGVKDYILKPVRRADLERIVENTISALEQRRAQLLENLNLATAALLNIPGYTAHFPVPCRPVLIADDAPAQPFSVSELLAVDNDRITVIAHRDGGYVLLFLFETPEYPGYCREYLKDLAERYQSGHTLVEGRKFKDGTCWEEDYRRMRTLACLRSACGGRRLYPHTCLPPGDSQDFLPVCRCCETCLETYGKSDYAGFTLACEALLKNLEPRREHFPVSGRGFRAEGRLARRVKERASDGRGYLLRRFQGFPVRGDHRLHRPALRGGFEPDGPGRDVRPVPQLLLHPVQEKGGLQFHPLPDLPAHRREQTPAFGDQPAHPGDRGAGWILQRQLFYTVL